MCLPVLICRDKVKLKLTKEAPIEFTARIVTVCVCSVHGNEEVVPLSTYSDHEVFSDVWCFITYRLTLHSE